MVGQASKARAARTVGRRCVPSDVESSGGEAQGCCSAEPCPESDLPIATGAADVVICSFVASYIEDMAAFAREVRRVCRAGATVLLTDLHPDTTRKLGWKRSFRTGEQEVVLKTWSHSREKLVAAFRDEAFEIECELQPEFGEQERAIFDAAG